MEHSDESIERAVLTLREMTQERRGRGISAVMMLEEQIIALRKDAERYRWLRDKAYTATAVQLMQHMPGEMDGAVDHAMQMDAQDAALRASRAVGAA